MKRDLTAAALFAFLQTLVLCPAQTAAATNHAVPRDTLRPLMASSTLVFSFAVESITPQFPIDDMPYGHKPWALTARVTRVYKGSLGQARGSLFRTTISIYQGPVRSRPSGLWVNEIPMASEQWVLFCSDCKPGVDPAELLSGEGKSGQAVYRLEAVRKGLRSIETSR